MFDSYAQTLFEYLPDLAGLNGESARRMLSRAYLALIQLRTGDSAPTDAALDAIDYLRRLANTVEFHAVLEENADSQLRRAGAFVAGECLALLADSHAQRENASDTRGRIRGNETFSRIESAILYLISRFDACAAGVLVPIPPPPEEGLTTGERAAEWCLEILRSLCEFRLNPLPPEACPVEFDVAAELPSVELEDDTAGRLYGLLGEGVSQFIRWLAGAAVGGADNAIATMSRIVATLTPENPISFMAGVGGDFGRIRHLAVLLKACFPELGLRALVQTVPVPPGFSPQEYGTYLRTRALGEREGGSGRPVLWPSAEAYVSSCLIGDAKHAVVSMPTGSGKSFLAELAVSHAVGEAWSLYLAPTNALTEQIRGDLKNGLKSLGTEIMAFVGDREYSVLKTEAVSPMRENSVAVMTPEKAFLALRLYPEVFATCGLVVFDECHLLGEGSSGRGVTAELVLSQLMLRCPNVRFLLMSAIIQNPDDLANWLRQATGLSAAVLRVPWRPTRTLRTAIGVDTPSAKPAYQEARQILETLPDHRKNVSFLANYALACGLQGAWQSTAEEDYGIVMIPCKGELQASRKMVGRQWNYFVSADKWVNGSAVRISGFLAEHRIQTLVFTPANKHYPFSNADKTSLSEGCRNSLEGHPSLVATCRALAEYEFGIASEVFRLLDLGLSVHTAHMIETEKIASELAFRKRSTRIMFATGTLAQGLNLPAMAVVIAGTRIGDPRGEDAEVVEQRKLSQLLNAAGRAGRAGFANQGLVIAIPDDPLLLDSQEGIDNLRGQLGYMQQPDNAVRIDSGLGSFLDQISKGVLTAEHATQIELQAIAVLAGGDEGQPAAVDVLRRSYAAFQRRVQGLEDIAEQAGAHLNALREAFVDEKGVPKWVPIAAQRAGLDFFLAMSLVNSWTRVRESIDVALLKWDVRTWRTELLRVLSRVPPGILLRHYPIETLSRGTKLFGEAVGSNENLQFTVEQDWDVDENWVAAWLDLERVLEPWMNGDPLVEIAAIISGLPMANITPRRTSGSQPIPKTLALVNDLFSSLAILGGGLVAIAEQRFKEAAEAGDEAFESGVPLALNCMPMCIKYGCDSPGSLAWFRFGVRLRRPSRLLHSAFPPPELGDDERLRDWVREHRRDWLNGDVPPGGELLAENEMVFNATADFIRRE